MSWLLSPTSLFSRTSSSTSSSSIPTLFSSTPKRSVEKSKGDEDAPLTPFEREYGVPDLPGGWPGWDLKSKLDEATPRQELDVVVQENGHVKVISLAASASKSINSKVEVGVGGKERSSEGESGWERDIWVTKLVVHPIKVIQRRWYSRTAIKLRPRLSSPFAHIKKNKGADLTRSVSTRNSRFDFNLMDFARLLLRLTV